MSRITWAVDGYGSRHYFCEYCELVFGNVNRDNIIHECDTSKPRHHNRDKFLIDGAVIDYDTKMKLEASN